MPLYDFTCNVCTTQFEAMSSSDTCPPCPKCQGETSRQLSAPYLKTGAMPYTPQPNNRPMPTSGGGCSGGNCGSCSGC